MPPPHEGLQEPGSIPAVQNERRRFAGACNDHRNVAPYRYGAWFQCRCKGIFLAPPSLRRSDPDLAADERAIGPRLFEILRSDIIAARLMPGQGLSEKEVAARFGVSRQPVREAFIKLAEVGLLQIVPSRGSFVSRISIRNVLSARFVREAVECALVRVAARIASREQCQALQSSIEAQRAAIDRGDELLFNHLDERFHREIAAIAECEYASQVIEHARAGADRVRSLAMPEPVPRELLVGQHAAISERIAAGDPDGAAAAMSTHLRNILKVLPLLQRNQPELFDPLDRGLEESLLEGLPVTR